MVQKLRMSQKQRKSDSDTFYYYIYFSSREFRMEDQQCLKNNYQVKLESSIIIMDNLFLQTLQITTYFK